MTHKEGNLELRCDRPMAFSNLFPRDAARTPLKCADIAYLKTLILMFLEQEVPFAYGSLESHSWVLQLKFSSVRNEDCWSQTSNFLKKKMA